MKKSIQKAVLFFSAIFLFSSALGQAQTTTYSTKKASAYSETYRNTSLKGIIKKGGQSPEDKTPPSVQVTTPQLNEKVSGLVTIEANASDNVGIDRVEFYANGNLVGTSKAAPYSAKWDSTKDPDGSLTVTAAAYDKAGNTKNHMIQVTTKNLPDPDKVPPSISILTPGDGDEVKGNAVKIKVDASDDKALEWVKIYPNDSNFQGNVVTFQNPPYETTWDTTNLIDGAGFKIAAVARDKAGNESTAKITVSVHNKQQPLFSIKTAPKEGDKVSGTVTITVNTDPDNLVNRLEIHPGTQGMKSFPGGGPYTVDWHTAKEPLGNNAFTVIAYDKNNDQLIYRSIGVVVEAAPDVKAPKVTITNPNNGDTISGNAVNISCDVEDDGPIQYVTFCAGDNWCQDVKSGVNGTHFVTTWDSTTAKDGNLVIRATAMDKGNNWSDAQITVKLENDPNPPNCEITAPQDGDEVSGNVTVKVSASDDKALDNVQIYPNYGGNGITGQAFHNPPFEYTFDSTKVPDGTIPIAAIAVDKAGHETKAQIRVKVANEAMNNPYHQITFDIKPSPDSVVKGITTLSINCRPDDSKVDRVEVVYGQPIRGGNPFEYEWDTTQETNGQHGFTISAFDQNGAQIGAQTFMWDVQN